MVVERRTLASGDYTLIDDSGNSWDSLVIIERKSLDDFVGCIGRGRARFERELERLARDCAHPFVFIEGTVQQVADRAYSGRTHPASIIGSVCAWSLDYGVHFWWLSNRACAAAAALRLLAKVEDRAEKGTPPWITPPESAEPAGNTRSPSSPPSISSA